MLILDHQQFHLQFISMIESLVMHFTLTIIKCHTYLFLFVCKTQINSIIKKYFKIFTVLKWENDYDNQKMQQKQENLEIRQLYLLIPIEYE